MKAIPAICLLISSTGLFAQTASVNNKIPGYIIHLTTANDNLLKGLLLNTTDSSANIYPGSPKEWNANKHYKPVLFNYKNIKAIQVQKKNARLHGMMIGGGIGISVFAASFLFQSSSTKQAAACLTFPLIPAGMIIGTITGSRRWKKFYINSNAGSYQSFINKLR